MRVGSSFQTRSYWGEANGTLVLEVKRGFELEIQMEQIKILSLANNFFGFKVIDKIKIIKNGYN